MPHVLITPESMRQQPGPYVDVLREAGFEVHYPRNPRLARGLGGAEEAIAELQGMQATLASSEPYDGEVLEACPELRVIARVGVGYDRVDVAAATARGIPVTITPHSNHEAVAELTMALLLAMSKRLVNNDRAVRAGQWPRQLVLPVRGRTMGIVGLGRIGRSTAVRARAFGMPVVATEQFPDPEFVRAHDIRLLSLDELLAGSDVVSLHCPLNDETRGLMNRQRFAAMKPGSMFLNTARGGLVVEADLVTALREGPLAAAGLDVYAVEPPVADNPLFALDNVTLSPHIAGTDTMSLEGMGVEAATNVVKLFQGEWPAGSVVNEELRGSYRW